MEDLIFSMSKEGRNKFSLPQWECDNIDFSKAYMREKPPELPDVAEVDLVRHYINLSREAYGVDNGFYPLGSCTMKYNPKVNEEIPSFEGFRNVHPLQSDESAEGCREVIRLTENCLCEICGMDAFTLQPAAGAQGEFTALAMVKDYFKGARTKILIPDSAHGTNPASAAMCGFEVIVVPSNENGEIDVSELSELMSPDIAALMMTNPNTLGIFESNIDKISDIVHSHGGLMYYDGANLNAVMGIMRPGDMGFDFIHLNLHKSFAAPHGGGGPGSGPVGCKDFLKDFIPKIHSYYGNFSVYLKSLAYIVSIGAGGLQKAAENAVMNANYLMKRLNEKYTVAYECDCMHEFVLTLKNLKKDTGITAADIAKNMIDYGIHPPTMYFPLIVEEALMFEPTETESIDTLDDAADLLLALYDKAYSGSIDALKKAPQTTVIGRPDEVLAARELKLTHDYL